MKVERISASSLELFDNCQFKYYLERILKHKFPENIKGICGNIVHKVLEILARYNKNRCVSRRRHKHPEDILKITLAHYSRKYPLLSIMDYESFCNEMLQNALKSGYGASVLNGDIIGIEKVFWFALSKNGTVLFITDKEPPKGDYILVNGFIDLVNKIDNDTLWITDWKTVKTRPSRHFDKWQARIYEIAARLMYPEYNNIVLHFVYLQLGKIDPVLYSKSDHDNNMQTIAAKAKEISSIKMPGRNKGWLCNFCDRKVCESEYNVILNQHLFG